MLTFQGHGVQTFAAHLCRFLARHVDDGLEQLLVPVPGRQHEGVAEEVADAVQQCFLRRALPRQVLEVLHTQPT